jgi:peptide/nickel transport system permease protein
MRLPAVLLAGLTFIVASALVALAAPWIASSDPVAIDFSALVQPPSAEHWFGTDNTGRDVFSRVVYGTRYALYIGLMGVMAPLFIGVNLGLIAGYFGGWADTLIMRLADLTVPFPFFVLVLAIVAVLGSGIENYFIALALVGWVGYARLAAPKRRCCARPSSCWLRVRWAFRIPISSRGTSCRTRFRP